MTLVAILDSLSARGVFVTVAGDSIELDAPADVLTNDDLASLRTSKQDIVRLLRLADGLPIDDSAALVLAMDEVDPDEVPACMLCSRSCDTQTLDDAWHCSRCESDCDKRRLETERLLRHRASILRRGER